MNELIKPKKLKEGSVIGVASPAGIPDKEKSLKAGKRLESMGFTVRFGDALGRNYGYLAGTDKERAAEINDLFQDKTIDAVVCSCGGYGAPRIAPLLNYELIRANPKVFWGYSDVTFLHTAIRQEAGLLTFHGPMLSSDLGHDEALHPLTEEHLRFLKHPGKLTYTEAAGRLEALVEGVADGWLVGGNLTLLVNSLGTPYEIDTKGALLFIEETEEEPYQIDRMLNQLKLAGKFKDARGILLCDFNDCRPKKRKPSFSLKELFEHYIVPAGKPVLSGFKAGHCTPNFLFPAGAKSRMNTYAKTVMIENPFS
ncbi:S66 peptidase family protein [Salipaludibacillus aurantiacus]|uniref:Muramoyltetrapeptide carboxypeptidase n=1 Tax=Salipaludibacillus aurantiacus TaxID=1601833 RepID=A0A1H9SJF3_9BACI|nr:LD-carboxypeptidase [Salipaludibacillus aurantiacus]SER85160.1 muramoyltetrapeptide carboxypeptidase [Salipaludibacillus aurantiacus]